MEVREVFLWCQCSASCGDYIQLSDQWECNFILLSMHGEFPKDLFLGTTCINLRLAPSCLQKSNVIRVQVQDILGPKWLYSEAFVKIHMKVFGHKARTYSIKMEGRINRLSSSLQVKMRINNSERFHKHRSPTFFFLSVCKRILTP